MTVVKVQAEVKTPSVPNFLLFADETEMKLDVADISDDSLKEIGRIWTDELLKNAAARRVRQKEADARQS